MSAPPMPPTREGMAHALRDCWGSATGPRVLDDWLAVADLVRSWLSAPAPADGVKVRVAVAAPTSDRGMARSVFIGDGEEERALRIVRRWFDGEPHACGILTATLPRPQPPQEIAAKVESQP